MSLKKLWPLLLLLALVGVHAGAGARWLTVWPTPPTTIHGNDLMLAQRASAIAAGRPLVEPGAVPSQAQLYASQPSPRLHALKEALRNTENPQSYWTGLPLTWVLQSVPSWALGLSPTHLRWGGLLAFGALIAACWGLARQVGPPHAALASAAAVSLLPAVWVSSRTAFPALGNMLGVTLAMGAVLAWARTSHPAWGGVAGALCALATRWGETAGDGLICLTALAGGLVVASLQVAWSGRRAPARALVGAVCLGASFALALDWTWLRGSFLGYVVREGQLEGSTHALAGLWGRIQADAAVYPWALRYSLIGLPGCVLLAAGAVASLLRPGWGRWALWAAALGQLVLLTAAAKRNNYYLAASLPLMTVAAVTGLGALPRVGSLLAWVGALLCAPMWHHLAPLGEVKLTHPEPRPWLGEDLVVRDPHLVPPMPAEVGLALSIPPQGVALPPRQAAWTWMDAQAARLTEGLPDASLILVLSDSPNVGDETALRLAAQRPGLRVFLWSVGAVDPRWEHLLRGAPGHLVVQVAGDLAPGPGAALGPPPPGMAAPPPPPEVRSVDWLGPLEEIATGGGVRVFRLR